MNLGNIQTADCVNVPAGADPRCQDPAFALSNPDLCPVAPFLIIKPSVALACTLGSTQFGAFYVKNGVETDVTDQAVFLSSDLNIAVVGASSGNATGLSVGAATISATYQDLRANAEFNVLGDGCCDQQSVAMMVLMDTSKSMSQVFGGSYASRLAFAKAAATRFISEVNGNKDLVGLEKFNITDDTVLASPTGSVSTVQGLVAGIAQTSNQTEFHNALATAVQELNTTAAERKVLVIISDGEDTTASYGSSNNPIAITDDFKAAGGIVICLGCRASGKGYRLLSAFSTGGFFVNAYPGVENASLDFLSGLKGYVCAGNCTPLGDYYVPKGALNYAGFANWDVIGGTVDLQGNGFFDFLPGNGLYVDLAGTNPNRKGKLQSKTPFTLTSGDVYRLSLDLSGNQRVDATPESVRVQIFYLTPTPGAPVLLLDQKVTINDFTQPFTTYSFSFTAPAGVDAYISIQQEEQPAGFDTRIGLMLNRVQFRDMTTLVTLLDDNFDGENMTYVPPRCGPGLNYGYAGYGTLNNCVPVMSGPTTPSGEASASSELATDFAWKAFDHNTDLLSSFWGSDHGLSYTEQWIQYKFASSKIIQKYAITARDDSAAPVDMTLSGSNDGSSWTVLDKQTGLPAWGALETRNFTIASPGSYLYYRLTIQHIFVEFDNGVSIIEFQLFCGAATIYGYACYGKGCLDEPPGPQLPDPHPLPDIESGVTPPPKQYTSTKTACAQCPPGTTGLSPTNLVPVMTSNTAPSGEAASSGNQPTSAAFKAFDSFKAPGGGAPAVWSWQSDAAVCWLRYKFNASATVGSYKVFSYGGGGYEPTAWTFEGSNNGSAWTILDTQSGLTWFQNEAKSFVAANTTAYQYYRLNITANGGRGYTIIAELELYGNASAQVCETATATSDVSQADADAQATAAALAAAQSKLNCVTVYSSTEQYTARCAQGSFGADVTKSASATSLVSQADADAIALAAATAAALAALDCSGSNNTQKITINDNAAASPYPSVQFISGKTGTITKVVLNLFGFAHQAPDDVHILLRSPAGTLVEVMRNAGSGTSVTGLNISFDDAAGAAIPAVGPIVAGTFKPSNYSGQANYPAPVPAQPYAVTLATFNGEAPNGSWALYVFDDTTLDTGQIANGFTLDISSA